MSEACFCLQFCHMSEQIRPGGAEADSGFQGDFLKNSILSSDFILVNRGKAALFEKKTRGQGMVFMDSSSVSSCRIGVHVFLTPAQPLVGWAAWGMLLNSLESQIPHLLEKCGTATWQVPFSTSICRRDCPRAVLAVPWSERAGSRRPPGPAVRGKVLLRSRPAAACGADGTFV